MTPIEEENDGSMSVCFYAKDCEGTEYAVSVSVITYDKLVESFRQFSLAVGYHPDTIAKYLDTE